MVTLLIERGHLAVEYGSRGHGHSNTYRPLASAKTNPRKERTAAILDEGAKERLEQIKERTVAMIHSNHLERPYGPRSVYVETLSPTINSVSTSDDVRESPALETEAAGVFSLKQAPIGGLVSNKIEQSKPTNTVATGSSFLKTRVADEISNGRELLNGYVSRRSEHHQPHNPKEAIPVTTILPDDEHFERFFQALLAKYPRRDAVERARNELRAVLDAANDASQLRSCLTDGAERYERDMRAEGSHQFQSLAAFIVDGTHWRPDIWPFNRVAA
jgi:hypothetical protein